ncbi:MAG: HEAT repeat domain-containing protein [Candidatus Omnitrophica bacterium]|nr:HEAT repeat domain-containing protein [Candidatus Omnitrophota bacterium]MCM8776830.1 HEAT repeat domain-containing protein [Candidatus Omnitrophota bacterium]
MKYNKNMRIPEKIKRFYNGLSKKRKVIFWTCIGIFSLSIIRISVWYATKGVSTSSRYYLKKLYSQNPEEKKFAIYEVGRMGLNQSIPELEKILRQEVSPDIKRAACWSIGRIDKEKLVALLDTTEKETKEIVMEALLKLDRNNISILLDRFSTEDEETKFKIIAWAEKSKDRDVYLELLKIGEMKEETISVRKHSLEIATKNLRFIDTESTLWNIYYNDPEKEMKEFAHTLIKELKEKK